MSSTKYFTQEGPRIGNQYDEDAVLREYLKRKLPAEVLGAIEPDLHRFGDRVMKDVFEWGNEVENQKPQLVQFDAWGNRIDEIVVCNGWNQLKKVSAEEGLIAIAYERKLQEYSRTYQFAKLYLFGPSSSIFTCPLAMTDGAARLIELNGNSKQKEGPYKHLTTRDPNSFWTSGQWMTEKTGGSDVGNSETIAVKDSNNNETYSISGYKFFTSAITSEMTVLLARAKEDNGSFIKGSKGLSTFYLEMRKENGKLNNLTVQKLKNKVGTRGLPTAEIELTNSVGYLIGNKHQGIKVISTILNITRIHNAVSCVSTMRRAIAVATNYANKRYAFGKLLKDQPLHIQTLSDIQLEFQSAFYFLFHTIHLLGRIECSKASKEEEILFRLLTPLLKLYTAKQAVSVTSECLESLGGTGYMEDEPYSLAKLWRDVQVCPIWEGTTNVLSLDVWRPLKSEGAYDIFVNDVQSRLNTASSNNSLTTAISAVKKALEELTLYINKCMQSMDKEFIESTARHFAFSLSRVYMASLLIEQAHFSKNATDVELANRWCFRQNLTPVSQLDANLQLSSKIVFNSKL